ncbi:hypothetical protein IEQ34_014570 [Dendrobium chrysotoxum]|uniref:Uncharacterized protein n=1 Tax=Dendrobium chrysotoxum TaxID=161865 RepID=A0AAV7GME5_DENCH|nr:hypothetical protein IEQ34_014570 [Dendrobium chrysotoxum]
MGHEAEVSQHVDAPKPISATSGCSLLCVDLIFKFQFKSMAGQLHFAFQKGLTCEQIDLGNQIQFRLGFSTTELTLDGKSILSLNVAEVDSPVLELVLGPVTDPIEAPEIGSIFEKGSSSGIPFTSKNQKKNYLRRVRRKIAKSRKIVEFKTLAQVDLEPVEDLPIPASSPLLQGSRFHPLAAASGEERVSRIASIPPRPVDYSTKRTPEEKQLQRTRMLRNIIHTCAAQMGETKEQYVKHLKGVISHRFEKEILREEKSDAKNLTPQSVRRNKKFVRQPAASVLVDGYHRVPRPLSSKMEGIVLTGSERGRRLVGRPPAPLPPPPKLASVVVKAQENSKAEGRVEVKGKRAKSLDKKYVPKKTSRVNIPSPVVKSLHSQIELPQASTSATKTPIGLIVSSDTSVMDPVDTSVDSSKFLPSTPRLLVRVSEDSTLLDVGVSTLQTPASSFEVDAPHLVKDATLLTTDPGMVEGEELVQDEDHEIIEQLIAEPPTANELKLQAIISSLQ